MNRRTFLTSSTASMAVLSACTVGEDFVAPEKDVPEQFFTSRSARSVDRGYVRWWQEYNDPKLNRLVELGLEQNLDVRRAQARVEQSKALLAGSGFPLSGNTRVVQTTADFGGNEGRSNTGFARTEATWQLDLNGRLTREKEAAAYRLDSAFADVSVARTTLLDELVTAYIDARFFQELIRINERVVESREETLKATLDAQARAAEEPSADATGGDDAAVSDNQDPPIQIVEVSELDVAQARTLVAVAKADLPEVRVLFFKAVSRVGALLGQAWDRPREGLDREAPQPEPNIAGLQTGVPADLIRNRPDVIFAENRLAEAVALVGVAEADLYPELRLIGNINVNVTDGATDPLAGFVRGGLDIPLFDLPERRARVEFQRQRANELKFTWEKEVVQAVEEVQDALVSLKNRQEAVIFTNRAKEELEEVLRLARSAYVAGETSFLQVLDAERALLQSENSLALDKRNFAVDFVDLNVALGGNYS